MKKRYILNILGSFGSGKSSLARALMPTDEEPQVLTFREAFGQNLDPEIRPGKVMATIFEKANTAWVGPYKSACGGCDSLVKVEIFAALRALLVNTGYNIVFEGVAVSGVRTYLHYIRDITGAVDILPMVVALHATVETHHARVMKRNGGKPVNMHHIQAKHRAVETRILELPFLEGVEHVVIDRNTVEETAKVAKAFIHYHTSA